MKRPAQIGGRSLNPRRRLPRLSIVEGPPGGATTGACFLCRQHLGEPRAGSIVLVNLSGPGGKYSYGHRLTCRDQEACRDRRRKDAQEPENGG